MYGTTTNNINRFTPDVLDYTDINYGIRIIEGFKAQSMHRSSDSWTPGSIDSTEYTSRADALTQILQKTDSKGKPLYYLNRYK
jgi:hypothetical protein